MSGLSNDFDKMTCDQKTFDQKTFDQMTLDLEQMPFGGM
jgi:hypothetical protein